MNCGSENLGGYAWIPYFVEVILTGISAGESRGLWAMLSPGIHKELEMSKKL